MVNCLNRSLNLKLVCLTFRCLKSCFLYWYSSHFLMLHVQETLNSQNLIFQIIDLNQQTFNKPQNSPDYILSITWGSFKRAIKRLGINRPYTKRYVRQALIFVFNFGFAFALAEEVQHEVKENPQVDMELGAEINETCAGCHGEYAEGGKNGEYPRLAGLPAEYMRKQIHFFKTSQRLNLPMKPYANDRELPDDDVYSVTAYIEAIQLQSIMPEFEEGMSAYEKLVIAKQVINIAKVEGDIQVGKYIYNKDCKICHGKNGKGKANSETPRLTGQYTEYLLKQINAYKTKARFHDYDQDDDTFANYTEQQIQNLLAYLSVADDQ